LNILQFWSLLANPVCNTVKAKDPQRNTVKTKSQPVNLPIAYLHAILSHMSKNMRKYMLIALAAIMCISLPKKSHSESVDILLYQDKIKVYRAILKKESDPRTLAEAHYKIAESLEVLGRDTEATAEYLKIILNYSDVTNLSDIAEQRLKQLYNKFSDEEDEVLKGKAVREETKDPAIFFTYIKSLYETYMSQGNYDRAVYLLKKLIKMDESKQSYYDDLGSIYLDGYNDADNALLYFNKLLEFNPDHPKVYTDIGLAYEKKGDVENAIKAYQKAVELSPFNSWSMYGVSRMDALNLAKENKLVKDWYFLGPFDNIERNGLQKEYEPESSINIDKVYTGYNDKEIVWFRPFSYEDSGYVDLNSMFDQNDNVVVYALTYAFSQADRSVQIRVGADDPIAVWLNGKLIFRKDVVLRPAQFDRDIIKATLKKGWNEIIVKTAESFGRWGFYFRVTDEKGNTPMDVVFDPLKDDARTKMIISKFKRQKGFKVAKVSMVYGFAIAVFLAGIYLLVSNIHNKVLIRKIKEDFIASVSHELKTPLAAIKMFTETLNMGRVREPQKVKEYYETIIRETVWLTRFINKILDFQKIEKHKKIYTFEEVDVNKLLESAVDIYVNQVQDSSLVVERELSKELQPVPMDEDAMLQVFLNFLTNAYKYSKFDKYIKVKTEKTDENVLISITDKGMGISKDKITKIFDSFYRVDRDSTKDIKGSGIGLAFVKSVVEAHSGRIAVQSQLNVGSTFIISLPLER